MYGNPVEAVQVVELLDVGAPAASQVVIEVEASPINQYDLDRNYTAAAIHRPRFVVQPRRAALAGVAPAPCVGADERAPGVVATSAEGVPAEPP
jgi:hypothetical protein